MTNTEAIEFLEPYFGENNDSGTRLVLVQERLQKSGNWKDTKDKVVLTAYEDDDGVATVTLPPKYNTILSGGLASSCGCSTPLSVRNGWYESLPEGFGNLSGLDVDSFIELNGRFTTFRDWSVPLYLRFKFEVSESPNRIIIRGRLAGVDHWSTIASTWTEGIAVTPSGTTTLTTTELFDEPPYQIIKPSTNGRVSMYTVDTTGTETLVAVYLPGEKSPRWKRYKVPNCTGVSMGSCSLTTNGTVAYTKNEIDAMFGRSTALTATGSTAYTLSPSVYYRQWYQKLIVSGAYTVNLALTNSYAKSEAVYRIYLELGAYASTVNIKDASGATIQTVSGDTSNVTYFVFEALFNGSTWEKLSGTYIV